MVCDTYVGNVMEQSRSTVEPLAEIHPSLAGIEWFLGYWRWTGMTHDEDYLDGRCISGRNGGIQAHPANSAGFAQTCLLESARGFPSVGGERERKTKKNNLP